MKGTCPDCYLRASEQEKDDGGSSNRSAILSTEFDPAGAARAGKAGGRMSEGLSVGDVVTFCNEREGYRHNAIVVDFHENGFAVLVHVVESFGRCLPQVELHVPWTTADAEGRFYVVEARL